HVVGLGMVEFTQDLPGLVPCGAGRLQLADGRIRLTEVDEGVGLVVAVTEFVAQFATVLVAADGCGVVTEMVVGVPEAVPGRGADGVIAELLRQGEGLLAVLQGVLVVAEHRAIPANVVQGIRQPIQVAGALVYRQRAAAMLQRLSVALLPTAHYAEAVMAD